MNDKIYRLVAELLEGCAVPRSLGVLGAAREPFDALWDELHLFGYPSADEIERRLKAGGPSATEVKEGVRKSKSEIKALHLATKILVQLHGPALKELGKAGGGRKEDQ